jgi:phosphate transport system substrate-binding protein
MKWRKWSNMKKFIFYSLILCIICGISTVGDVYADKMSITIKGSTTNLPIVQRTAEEFMKEYPGINISVQGGGSGMGINSLIDGITDIADASRPMRNSELKQAVSNGINPKANIIAMDGIAIVVNRSNCVDNLTKEQIKNIFTGKISNWSDVGGDDSTIVIVGRDGSSGTFDTFTERMLDGAKTRPDALLQASNQAVLQVVSGTHGAIGYIGLGYVCDRIKAVTVNGIECTKDTVTTGRYPLARPLFMYTDGNPSGSVKKFIDFILSNRGQALVEEQGYVPLY